jgi:tetratricopeptide (TPR) repeat protein
VAAPWTALELTRPTRLAAIALFFIALAFLGTRGKLEATRHAELDLILAVRDELQAALDAERSVTGPLSGSALKPGMRSREASDWAAQLGARVERFVSSHDPATKAEDLDLRLARATLAVAERRFGQALASMEDEEPRPADREGRDRRAEALRVRADAHRDSGNPAAALAEYRKLALRRPDDLAVSERMAECLHALGEVDRALDAYSQLAKRLQARGELSMKRLDPQGATQDLGKAARIRAWLAGRGRSG